MARSPRKSSTPRTLSPSRSRRTRAAGASSPAAGGASVALAMVLAGRVFGQDAELQDAARREALCRAVGVVPGPGCAPRPPIDEAVARGAHAVLALRPLGLLA